MTYWYKSCLKLNLEEAFQELFSPGVQKQLIKFSSLTAAALHLAARHNTKKLFRTAVRLRPWCFELLSVAAPADYITADDKHKIFETHYFQFSRSAPRCDLNKKKVSVSPRQTECCRLAVSIAYFSLFLIKSESKHGDDYGVILRLIICQQIFFHCLVYTHSRTYYTK